MTPIDRLRNDDTIVCNIFLCFLLLLFLFYRGAVSVRPLLLFSILIISFLLYVSISTFSLLRYRSFAPFFWISEFVSLISLQLIDITHGADGILLQKNGGSIDAAAAAASLYKFKVH